MLIRVNRGDQKILIFPGTWQTSFGSIFSVSALLNLLMMSVSVTLPPIRNYWMIFRVALPNIIMTSSAWSVTYATPGLTSAPRIPMRATFLIRVIFHMPICVVSGRRFFWMSLPRSPVPRTSSRDCLRERGPFKLPMAMSALIS